MFLLYVLILIAEGVIILSGLIRSIDCWQCTRKSCSLARFNESNRKRTRRNFYKQTAVLILFTILEMIYIGQIVELFYLKDMLIFRLIIRALVN